MASWTSVTLVRVMVCCLSAASHYPNQSFFFVNWPLKGIKLIRKSYQNITILSQKYAFESVVCKFRPFFQSTFSLVVDNSEQVHSTYHSSDWLLMTGCAVGYCTKPHKKCTRLCFPSAKSFFPESNFGLRVLSLLCLSVCPCECVSVRQPRCCPRHNSSPIQAQSLATDMRRLFYSTWPPSFSSHIKKEVLSNRGGERRWPQNKTGVVHRYHATVHSS